MTNQALQNIHKYLILLMFLIISANFCFAEVKASIGIAIKEQDIVGIIANSPAHIAGLKVGDTILKVDNISTKDLSTNQIKDLIMGDVNTAVDIQIRRNQQINHYKIIRKDISTISLNIPQWKEFCPNGLEDVNFIDIENYKKLKICQSTTKKSKIIREITLFPAMFCGIQKGYEKSNNKAINNANSYWIARRMVFQKELQLCLANPDTQLLCFAKIREIETAKNNALSQEQIMRGQMILNQLNQSLLQMNLNEMNMNLNNINTNLFLINNSIRGF